MINNALTNPQRGDLNGIHKHALRCATNTRTKYSLRLSPIHCFLIVFTDIYDKKSHRT